MFRKLVIIGIILGLAGSALAIKYVGNPNAGNGWDTTSVVTPYTPVDAGVAGVWAYPSYPPGSWVLADGNGINPSNKDQHSTAEYPGVYVCDGNGDCTQFPEYDSSIALQYTGSIPMVAYDSDMDAGGLCWYAFEFDADYYVADMEVWNYNSYPGDCLPVGQQSPCQWSTVPGYSTKDWRISYSTDKIHWREMKNGTAAQGTALTQGPQEGWNWSDDAQYPDTITIDANAQYVVLTCVNSYQGGIRVGIGEARFETDPNRATKPYKNGGDKFMNMPLSWRPGDDGTIAKHRVYLSTNQTAVENRTASSVDINVPASSYDWPGLVPGPLDSGTQYYWAVDELNASNVVVNEGTGRLWEFTEVNLGLVDNFGSYYSTGSGVTYYTDLWNVWIDGWVPSGNHPSGALVKLAHFTYGEQSIEINYDNDGWWNHPDFGPYTAIDTNYSEVRVETDNLIGSCRDLTNGGVTAWIRTLVMGPNTNDANEQVYVQLEDSDGNTAKVQYLPATDMDDGEWHEWKIALNDFTGVDVTDVNAISLIVGDETGPPSGTGNGVIYFKYLRVEPPQCGIVDPDPTLAEGDLNDDCIVDWKDLAILVDDWLDVGMLQ